MKAVLFGSNEGLPPFDSSRFVPPERSGRVLDVWVAYYARLKTAIKRYEEQDSMQDFSDIPIMCKDPYYVTSSTKGKPKQEVGTVHSKKRKPPKPAKESIAATATSEGEGGPKKKVKASKVSHSDPSVVVATKKYGSRTSKAKKTSMLPVRSSVRLQEKPSNKSPNPSSSSSPVEVVKEPGSPASSAPASDHGDNRSVQNSPSPSVIHTITQGSFAAEASVEGNGAHSVSTCGSVPVQPDVVVEDAVGDPLVIEDVVATEQQDFHEGVESVPAPGDAPSPVLDVPLPASLPEPSEVVPLNSAKETACFSSFLPEEDACILGDFASRHEGFLLSEKDFPLAFLRPAYVLFVEFLRFVRTHSVADLLNVHKDKVVEDLKALDLFGFKGAWFDKLVGRLNQNVPTVAFEDMEEVASAIVQQSQ